MSWLDDQEEDPYIDPNLLPGNQDQPGGAPPPLQGTPTVPPYAPMPPGGGGMVNGQPGDGSQPPLDSSSWLPPSGTQPGGSPGMQNGQPSDGSSPKQPGRGLGGAILDFFKHFNDTSGGGNNASNAIAGGLGALNQSTQAAAARQATADLQNQRVALQQSQEDPYASLMHQTRDAYKADKLANMDFASKPITIPGRYGAAAGPTTAGRTWQPSASTRGNARAVLAMILAGKKTPTMTDPKNYGKEPVVENAPDYTPPWLR